MSNSDLNIDACLKNWGYWKRNYITGLDYPDKTLIDKIRKKEILGDGCKGGGGIEENKNKVFFKDNEEAQKIDTCYKLLSTIHKQEMAVLAAAYVYDWKTNKISKEIGTSRYNVNQLLKRGKILLEGTLIRVH
jgi:DNA-directed RNA polymerase specialized sigma24 family protein